MANGPVNPGIFGENANVSPISREDFDHPKLLTTMARNNSNIFENTTTTTIIGLANMTNANINANLSESYTLPPDFSANLYMGGDGAMELKQAREIAWSGVFIGAAFANLLMLTFLLAVTRGKRGYFGVRLYTVNLTIFAGLQILILAWTQPDDYFGLERMVSLCVRDFLNKYSVALLEWAQIVFLSATTLLIGDSLQRYRNNGIGISKLSWVLGLLILDIIPMVYIFVKGIAFEFAEIRPKPLAIYHVVVLLIFTLAWACLQLAVICVPFHRACTARNAEQALTAADRARRHALREKTMTNRLIGPPAPKPFTYAKLVGLLGFVWLTAWTQYTVFNLGVDLQPGGLDEAQEMAKTVDNNAGMQMVLKTVHQERLIFIFMSIQKWAAMVRPFFETLSALLLLVLPSIGSKFQMRKIAPIDVAMHDSQDIIRMTQNHQNDAALSASASMLRMASAPPANST